MLLVRAARLQNEIALKKFNLTRKTVWKTRNKTRKMIRKRDRTLFSPSQGRLKIFDRHFSKSFSSPKICTKKITARLCRGSLANYLWKLASTLDSWALNPPAFSPCGFLPCAPPKPHFSVGKQNPDPLFLGGVKKKQAEDPLKKARIFSLQNPWKPWKTPHFHVRCPQIGRNCSHERSLERCHSHAFFCP